ncbi:hypothetical protein R6Q59_008553 [Mikania micrantha]
MAGEEEGTHRHTGKEKAEPPHHRGPHSDGLAEETVVTSGRRHLLRKWSLETVLFMPDTSSSKVVIGEWPLVHRLPRSSLLTFSVSRFLCLSKHVDTKERNVAKVYKTKTFYS